MPIRSLRVRPLVWAVVALIAQTVATRAIKSQALKSPQYVRGSNGVVVEVIGLRRWTVAMIQDSLDRYSPGDSLQKHSCAAVLRYKLGFADAAAMYMGNRMIVTVREPQDSARVRMRKMPLDTANRRRDWAAFTRLIERQPALLNSLPKLVLERNAKRSTLSNPAGTAQDTAVAFVAKHKSPKDLKTAREVLRTSPNYLDRVTAVLVLANFPNDDDTYYTLVSVMQEQDGWVKGIASTLLRSMLQQTSRRVNWRPVEPSIHAMLNGSSLFEIPDLIDALLASEVGPASAPALLAGGGEILVAYMESTTTYYSDRARKLLVKLNGSDLGSDPARWHAWIASL